MSSAIQTLFLVSHNSTMKYQLISTPLDREINQELNFPGLIIN